MKPLRNCELCDEEASLYCVSDSAFLCWSCDSRVHEANFLVARHVRRVLCFRCKDFAERCFSGATLRPIRCQCSSCPLDNGDGNSSSSGSICISSAESFTARTKRTEIKKSLSKADSAASQVSVEECLKPLKPTLRRRFVKGNIDIEAEAILTNWCRKLGFGNPCTLPLALHAFGICSQRLHFLPLRVGLACSLLFSSRLCEKKGSDRGQGQDQGFWLKKIEGCSGVPARVIVLAESKLAQILKMKKGHEEGWAECTH